MTELNKPIVSLNLLKTQLKDALLLDFDDFALEQNNTGEYSSEFLGVHLQSAFQPIYDIASGDLFGHEALLRPFLGKIQETTPEFAFSYAEASGKLVKLDRVSRTLHVLNYNQIFQEKGLLFLNVHPNLLISVTEHGKVFERILHAHSVPTERVVIEIRDFSTPEQHENLVTYEKQLAAAIENYHERGYKIAIDNFGNQHSLISRLWKLKPDFIKFDRTIIQQAATNSRLENAFHGLSQLIKGLGAQAIVSGIETQEQLNIATAAGVHLLQGFIFSKPVSAKNLQSSEVLKRQFNSPNP
jgi:EAL domain-containing protein (putative c-di-GMP-specific phosphodiesterase class I)